MRKYKGNCAVIAYVEDRIKIAYFYGPNLLFEESLMAIEGDIEVRKLGLLTKLEFVCIYVEHIGVEPDSHITRIS